ncbi:GTPase IMAP family member 4-like [Brachyhypopomus gauderio]|uniref:GTPase IMAP family member 4-like n=1 Tax=Brachyhypopomus gauderio TaxID=698409 RepID=UPI0040426735
MATASESDHLKILLLGGRWAGKSSSGNTIVNKEVFSVGAQTEVCIMETNKIAGVQVTVVDTPSWNWVSANDTSEELKQELRRGVEMLGEGSHVFLMAYPLGAPFVKRHKIAVQEHLELLGADVWNHTLVLFSRGDWLGEASIDQHIVGANEELKWLVEQCKNRYHVLNNKVRSDEFQVIELLEKIKQIINRKRKWSKTEPPECKSTGVFMFSSPECKSTGVFMFSSPECKSTGVFMFSPPECLCIGVFMFPPESIGRKPRDRRLQLSGDEEHKVGFWEMESGELRLVQRRDTLPITGPMH